MGRAIDRIGQTVRRMTRRPDCWSMLKVLDPLGVERTDSGARPPAPGRGTPDGDVMTEAPVTVTRVKSATGWWEFARRAPDRLLTGLVAGRCGYQEQCDGPLRRHLAAGSLVPLILSFGDRLDLLDKPGAEGAGRSYGSLVAGLHPGPAITEVSGTQFAVQVYLSPLGAYQILGVPGAALAHRLDELADVAPVWPGHCRTDWHRCVRGHSGWPSSTKFWPTCPAGARSLIRSSVGCGHGCRPRAAVRASPTSSSRRAGAIGT